MAMVVTKRLSFEIVTSNEKGRVRDGAGGKTRSDSVAGDHRHVAHAQNKRDNLKFARSGCIAYDVKCWQ